MVQLHRKLLEEHPLLARMPAVMLGDFNVTTLELSGWEKATMKTDCAKSLPMSRKHVDHLYLWCPTTPSSAGSLPKAAWLTKAETIAASMGTQLGVGKTPRTLHWQQNGLLSASNHNPCVAALGLPKQPTHTSEQLQALKAACRTMGSLKLRNKP
ncbi:hypothetical protein HaLaN_13308 [Haematococcus lacustris]|uniref:Uncharacterized protein n=1 Tax=Haematococcus lacustris TaxID=44745 RepID=A0A699Z402_HAELA|nr:hypothetical protein HaLaN_13308 [Haematococcus lacustris]